ncbi:hypothetical protein RC74_15485 [Falsihalocynthiibacter arcticus]|uniref:Uncharacterized protein n=2 Tax=Falsihalocynthiibacter arcticus TaxID=1579316 RepID=A0A126V3N5_9RHOB|nr:hypothetical protein RC74_15485 [Falsihalocynthiibacter arcticus]
MAFEGVWGVAAWDIMHDTYQAKFLECRAQTDGTKNACRESVQKWANRNTVVIYLGFYAPTGSRSVTLFMIEDRLYWEEREIN